MVDQEKDKHCIYKHLYVKPFKNKETCYECRDYNEDCRHYIPMVESNLEMIARIHRQLKYPLEDE